MPLDTREVARIAHLARLELGDEECERLVGELGRILELVAQMDRADTADVEPMAHPIAGAQRLRPDEVTEVVDRERFQAIAPAVAQGLYLVPKVIE